MDSYLDNSNKSISCLFVDILGKNQSNNIFIILGVRNRLLFLAIWSV